MRVVIVGAGREENLSAATVAAAVRRAGHAATIVDFDYEEEVERTAAAILAEAPDAVGLSMAFQHRAWDFVLLARRLRALGFRGHLMAGGHVPTASWREILAEVPEIDAVVRHDGEETVVELLAAAGEPERWPAIAGVACRAGGEPTCAPPRRQVDDLDRLPWPARDRPLPRHAGQPFAPLVGSRGCFADCNYCCINTWHRGSLGRRFRMRSPADLAAEMAALYQAGARIYCFHDDNFFLPSPPQTRARLAALRGELEARGVGRIAFIAKCRPDEVEDTLLAEARALGLVRVYMGVENGSEQGLRNLNRLHTLAQTRAALDALRRSGVYACYNVLLYEPDTRLDDIRENIEFMAEQSDMPWNFARAEIYAGTNYERMLRASGRLRGNWLGYSYRIADERAEVMFRLTAVAFRVRNFARDAVANRSSSLGYEAAVLRHFRPGPESDRLVDEANAAARELNLDSAARLREAHDFVASGEWRDPARAQSFAAHLARCINRANLDFGLRLDACREAIRAAGERAGVG